MIIKKLCGTCFIPRIRHGLSRLGRRRIWHIIYKMLHRITWCYIFFCEFAVKLLIKISKRVNWWQIQLYFDFLCTYHTHYVTNIKQAQTHHMWWSPTGISIDNFKKILFLNKLLITCMHRIGHHGFERLFWRRGIW